MITKPTVLILGAGASMSYGFPSGLQLKAEICKAIKKRAEIFHDLVQAIVPNYQAENHPYATTLAKQHIEDFYNNFLLSSELSIDAFLEHNPKYFETGRRAIANVLTKKEGREELFDGWIDKWLDPENKDKHWYQLLFSKLNAPFEDFEKNDLTIITFNYDRSLEYFLWESMKAKYSEQDEKPALEKLRKISVIHVYGKLGGLPVYDAGGLSVPYGFPRSSKPETTAYLDFASRSIYTFHQAKEMSDFEAKAQAALRRAARIYFLGFGYDKINMERLFVGNDNGKNLLKDEGLGGKCWGTAMGVSPHHKRYLCEFGLNGMLNDFTNEKQGRTHKSRNFPDSTIYDFLYYNPHSILD